MITFGGRQLGERRRVVYLRDADLRRGDPRLRVGAPRGVLGHRGLIDAAVATARHLAGEHLHRASTSRRREPRGRSDPRRGGPARPDPRRPQGRRARPRSRAHPSKY